MPQKKHIQETRRVPCPAARDLVLHDFIVLISDRFPQRVVRVPCACRIFSIDDDKHACNEFNLRDRLDTVEATHKISPRDEGR